MKRIWLINQYAMPPQFESRLRTIKFAHYLTQAGYDVTIFASSVMHNMNVDLIEDDSKYVERSYGDLKFVHIKTQSYKTNGFSRVLGLIQFPLFFRQIAKKFAKPDIIIQTATVPFGNIIYYAAKQFKAQYIVEVLDLWPETLAELGLFSRKNPLMWFAYQAEKWLYKRADKLVYSMEGGPDYLKDKHWDKAIDLDKVHYINNGVDLIDFKYNVDHYQLDDEDLQNTAIKKVVYIGSIRLANNLQQLIDAAALLKSHENVKFLLYGDGEDRPELEKYCQVHGITNVVFKEKWIQPQYVPFLLSCSSVNILNYMPGGFGHYGGSQSKMFQYMASGKPICANLRMMYCPITKYNLGIAQEFKNSQAYANAILSLLELNSDAYNQMCDRNKNAAQLFDYKRLASDLTQLF